MIFSTIRNTHIRSRCVRRFSGHAVRLNPHQRPCRGGGSRAFPEINAAVATILENPPGNRGGQPLGGHCVLPAYAITYEPLHLYYPSRRGHSNVFRLIVEALRVENV